MNRIDISKLPDLDDIEAGQTVRYNHEDCPAGEDTRRRLYVTRVGADPTKLLAFCHNCQGNGIYTDSGTMQFRDDRHSKNISYPQQQCDDLVDPSPNMVETLNDWPAYAIGWAYGNGLTHRLTSHYGIMYDPNTDRVYLPRWNLMKAYGEEKREYTKLIGYQLRRVRPNSTEPKYLPVVDKHEERQHTWLVATPAVPRSLVVLVEDLASGIAVVEAASDAGYSVSVLVNYGVKVDPRLMYSLATTKCPALIWLDNDSDHVLDQARTMQRTITMYGGACDMLTDLKDPKQYPNDVICQRLEEVRDGFN